MKSVEWKTYRTRFLVKAKQLNSSLTFTDHLGRQHCGRRGDYLVESCDGVLSITPRRIFEDIYVSMGLAPDSYLQQSNEEQEPESITRDNLRLASLRIEPLRIQKIKANLPDGAFANVPLRQDCSHSAENSPAGARHSPIQATHGL